MVARGWREGEMGAGIPFWGDENVLELDSGDGCTKL